MQDDELISLSYSQLSDMIDRIGQIPPLTGTGAPTAATPAFFLGQNYVDTETGKAYYCSAMPGSGETTYGWDEVVETVQETGNSTTAVMSQAAVTSLANSLNGSIKRLSRKDINQNGQICVWLLDEGIYSVGDVRNFMNYGNGSISAYTYNDLFKDIIELIFVRRPSEHYTLVFFTTNENSNEIVNIGSMRPGFYSLTYSTISYKANDQLVSRWAIKQAVTRSTGKPHTTNAEYPGVQKGTLYEDTTNAKLYICTSASGSGSVRNFTWEEISNGNGYLISGAGIPTTTTAGKLGTLYTETSNGGLYQCTAIDDTTDPNNPSYTWSLLSAGSSIPIVQEIGTSTSDVMSQKATTDMIYSWDSGWQNYDIKIPGKHADSGIMIGYNARSAGGNDPFAIGDNAVSLNGGTAIGWYANAGNKGSIALGSYSKATAQGEMNIGVISSQGTFHGYNGSNYRLISGVYDGQNAHDAATVGQITPLTGSAAPTTDTVGTLGKIYIDTSTATAYMCVAADTATPSYTWKQITA